MAAHGLDWELAVGRSPRGGNGPLHVLPTASSPAASQGQPARLNCSGGSPPPPGAMDPAWQAELEARAADSPFARLSMCVPQARINDLCLRAAYTLWMMPQCTPGTLPCDWCGLPTGSWCESCPPPVTMGESENAENSRRVCTRCDGCFGQCRRCFAWQTTQATNRQPVRPATEGHARAMGISNAPPSPAPS